MSNSINWTGAKPMEAGMPHQNPKPITQPGSVQYGSFATPMPGKSIPVQGPASGGQDGYFPPSTGTTMPAPPTTGVEGPPPSTEKGYIPYYLSQNIGKSVKAEFIIGSNLFTDKTGVLTEVGVNYFVLYDVNSKANIMCDLYSVRFVTII